MSSRLKRKAACMIVIELICLILLGVFLTQLQTRMAVNNQRSNTEEKLNEMQALIDNADARALQNIVSYDEVYQSKAESIAYMANNDATFQSEDAVMDRLASMMNLSNVLLLDREGNIVAKAAATPADFTKNRYNQLRTVFETNDPSEAFSVTVDGTTYRYFGARINENLEAVVEQDPAELEELQDSVSSWDSILNNVTVGLDGFAFAVSSQDYTFLSTLPIGDGYKGADSLAAGLDVTELEDHAFGWMELYGNRYYCGVTYLDTENAYIVCAVPHAEIISSRNITVGIVLFIFFIVITIAIVYAILLSMEEEKNDNTNNAEKKTGKLYYNKNVARKILPLSVMGLIIIFAVSFYMQTLFNLSMRSMSNGRQAQEVEETLERNKEDAESITAQYNRRYLNKAQVAAYILSNNPQLQTKEEMERLSHVLDIEFMLIFDMQGKEVVSDSPYVNFEISQEPEDQSYEFNKILQGVEYVIQEAQPDQISGEYHQYIGVKMMDAEGNPTGFVQISIVPDRLESALAATDLTTVLQNVKASAGGFAFSVNKEDLTFGYFPEERLIGKEAVAYGMEESQFRDGYCDYITINNQKYYGASLDTDENYLYVVTPQNHMNRTRFPIAVASTAASLVCLLLVFIVLVFSRQKDEKQLDEDNNDSRVEVVMPDGSVKRTESAASRWSNVSVAWGEKSPEQRIGAVLKGLLAFFAGLICVALLLKDRLFDENSIFLYIINGDWERRVNIFSITACILIVCVGSVIIMMVRELLKLLSRTLGAKGETVCRMLRNFVKYVGVIAILYYCFALFGVDTQTLLASAGILSLVIGLGAKELVSDILAGLFIIFEGEFQVGDIVTIGDWRGKVQEIGIRTTKVVDPGENVKVFSNSTISGVINMTRKNSFCVCDVGIEYGESLEKVENILSKEFPNIKRRIPAIKDGPFYKGVVSLGDSSVNIRIVAQCAEADRVQLGRDLNREMKILFDRYDINIPFPQVVINKPTEHEKATAWERVQADKFTREQKAQAKGLEEEQKEEK